MNLSQLCTEFIIKKDKNEFLDKNAIEFITAPWGLGLGNSKEVPPLYPAQRFIIKCYYGLELDNSPNRDIIIKDQFAENELYRFNEYEYMLYLYNEGRINRVYEPYKFYPNLVLVCGRRAGKSTVVSCIVAYEVYKLLNKYSPQEYYGIMPEDFIKITCISTNKDTAGELFNKIKGHIERAEFFKRYRKNSTQQYISLCTQRDLDKYKNGEIASVLIKVAPCSARGLRGPGNIVAALDEMAFFFADERNRSGSSNNDKDDGAIYKAVAPSVSKFKKQDNTPDGKILCLSSPNKKAGKFYEEYERSFEENNNDILMIQAPTWEVDPNFSSTILRESYKNDPLLFKSEYGAQFIDSVHGWIDNPDIVRKNVIQGLKLKERSTLRVPHFMGIDLGLRKDGTAITIGHWVQELVEGEKVDKIEVDYYAVRYAKDEGKDYFDPEEMIEWIASFTDRFYIARGIFDQYYDITLESKLHKKGLRQFEGKHFNDSLNSNVFQLLLTSLISGTIKLPQIESVFCGPYIDSQITNVPLSIKETDTTLVKELLSLKAEQKSKYIIKVEAPETEGAHDDLSDSLARMVYIAHEYKDKSFTHNIINTSVKGHIMMAKYLLRSKMIRAELKRSTFSGIRMR
jgi:hypothetical protein